MSALEKDGLIWASQQVVASKTRKKNNSRKNNRSALAKPFRKRE
jgi:hypothetical protein